MQCLLCSSLELHSAVLFNYVMTLYIFLMFKFCSFKPLNYVLSLPSCFLFSQYALFATKLCYDIEHLLNVRMLFFTIKLCYDIVHHFIDV